jgi:hypothetical protein
MGEPVRVTQPLLDVFQAFLQALDAGAELHGWAIMKATARSGPTVYGILDRHRRCRLDCRTVGGSTPGG